MKSSVLTIGDLSKATGTKVSSVTLNPWLIGVGIGYRF